MPLNFYHSSAAIWQLLFVLCHLKLTIGHLLFASVSFPSYYAICHLHPPYTPCDPPFVLFICHQPLVIRHFPFSSAIWPSWSAICHLPLANRHLHLPLAPRDPPFAICIHLLPLAIIHFLFLSDSQTKSYDDDLMVVIFLTIFICLSDLLKARCCSAQ